MSAEILSIWDALGPQERLVLRVLGCRLLDGQRRYGSLDLANDPRDFGREAAEEAADLSIYRAIAVVRDELARSPEAAELISTTWITTEDAATRIGICVSAVRQAAACGKLRSKKDGGRLLICCASAAEYQRSYRGPKRKDGAP